MDLKRRDGHERGRTGGDQDSEVEDQDELRAAPDPWLFCADCDARVARPAAAIEVGGKHVHEFVNPAAEAFTVRCFAEAPGCMPAGDRSTVWSWFPGHAWQIELCRGCLRHLGWSFHGKTVFYGLIREALR